MVAVLIASVVAGGMGGVATPASADEHEASVSFSGGTSGGATIVVDEVTLPEGGFVTIHDASLTDGNTFGSVAGTSTYLESGTHENVTVHLDDGIEDGTFFAMAHQDTNDDRAYAFLSSNGGEDGPYTAGGDIVMESAEVTVSATVTASDQPTEGEYVVVDRVELSEGGFVTVHDSSLLDGAVFESVRGTSQYLTAGVHEDVRIQLEDPLQNDDTLLPMAHRDTNGNQAYDFPASEGEEDGPFVTAGGDAVLDDAAVELRDTATSSFDGGASGGTLVTVDELFVPEGGFVTMHDSSLTDGEVFGSIRGTSEYLAPGLHRDVQVRLDEPLEEGDTLLAMAHQDTNDNEAYDFPDTEGDEDGPYTADGDIVMDGGDVTVSASASLDRQTSDGTTVVVEDVDLSEGGFVTIHDASLLGGAALESVRGTSEYLEAGVHDEVTIELDEPIADTQQLIAMPHRDTNDNEAYDFVENEGGDDGPYTADGGAVVDPGTVGVTATVVADADASDAETVVVERVTLHNGGFVTVHDSSLTDGAVFESIRGTSEYLEPGTHEGVEITLEEPLEDDDTLFAMAHQDTNGNEAYDFLDSEGAEDGPYVAAGGPVMGPLDVTVEDMSDDDDTSGDDEMNGDEDEMNGGDDEMNGGDDDGMDDDEMNGGEDDNEMSSEDDEMNSEEDGEMSDDGESNETDDGSGPGFGLLAAFVALAAVAAAGYLVRRQA
ncbi:PGF-CTERM sorting domain-containing protein [Halobacteriales archaeon SW_10_66_29]|nr:MAG: PGF-CTERM sorting domain-containing protein [Halobacteriales archaeon SW_10_66_29]